MWSNILTAILTLGGIGIVLGGLLAVASRVFTADTDLRIEEVDAALPHANCGACGFGNCSAFAGAVVKAEASPEGCIPADTQRLGKIARILGVQVTARERQAAHVHCSGGQWTARRFDYNGIESCYAAGRLSGGPSECVDACLGYGDCVKICKFGAIRLEDGHALVDRDLCAGCGQCMAGCPRGIIGMIPAKSSVAVNCSSRERGTFVRSVCEAGCVGCTLCQQKCQYGAMTVVDNLAVVDYAKCVSCGQCAAVCPRQIITEDEILMFYGD